MEKLGPDFNLSRMLVVDLLHEFELGVWKSLFMHLIRVLYAAAPGGKLVAVLDGRYDFSIAISYLVHGFINIGFGAFPILATQYVDSLIMCPK